MLQLWAFITCQQYEERAYPWKSDCEKDQDCSHDSSSQGRKLIGVECANVAADLDGESHADDGDNGVGDDNSYGHALREVQLAACIAYRDQAQDSRLYKDLKHDHDFDQITGRKQPIKPCCDQPYDT